MGQLVGQLMGQLTNGAAAHVHASCVLDQSPVWDEQSQVSLPDSE